MARFKNFSIGVYFLALLENTKLEMLNFYWSKNKENEIIFINNILLIGLKFQWETLNCIAGNGKERNKNNSYPLQVITWILKLKK